MSEQMKTLSSLSHSYKTAIRRKRLSTPMRILAAEGRLLGRVLDYGSGKGDDARELGLECYDPYFKHQMPLGRFDTITCVYVLNVIEDVGVRREVLRTIHSRLEVGGRAYIAVRTDKAELKGLTSKGTWQGLITLGLTIAYEYPDFTIYVLRECVNEADCDMTEKTF
jgi:hypothetical protein